MVVLHLESLSWAGPVETGFKNVTGLFAHCFAAPLHSSVVKMVFPTSVLAPNTWYARCVRQRREDMGGGFIFAAWNRQVHTISTTKSSLYERRQQQHAW